MDYNMFKIILRIKKSIKFIFFYIMLIQVSCNQNSSSGDFSNLNVSSGDSVDCTFSSVVPDKKTVKIASSSTTQTTFTSITSTDGCTIKYYINGSTTEIQSADGIAQISSDLFQEGLNKLVVKASSSKGISTHEWVVQKNKIPSCASTIPANSSQISAPVGISTAFLASATDGDGDDVIFEWKIDNQASDKITTSINANTASQIQFTPDGNFVGIRKLTAEISDGLDKSNCEWNVNISGDCSIVSTLPVADNAKVAKADSIINVFQVNTASNGCVVDWKLNNIPLAGTDSLRSMASVDFLNGANILSAQTHSGGGSLLKTWTVFKNTPPTCVQTPVNTSLITTSVGASIPFSVVGSDYDQDSISYSWNINNTSVSPTILNSSSNAVGSAALLTPSDAQVGLGTLNTVLNDGLDEVICGWPIKVISACTIVSHTPLNNSLKISRTASVNSSFAVTPNDSSCTTTWTLNGSQISTSSFLTLNSLDVLLNQETNTLVATVSSGYGTPATQSWTLTKNRVPTCPSQTPSNPTVSVNFPNDVTFTANANDIDADTLTFNWKLNGAIDITHLFSYNNLATSSQAQFDTAISHVGNNSVIAEINDGYDSSSCSWNVSVAGDCSISSSSPISAMPRALSSDAYQNIFQINTSTPGCSVLWTLNGIALSGLESTKLIPSSYLLTGANSLIGTVSSGTGSTSANWTVIKNSLPTCSVQAPLVGAPIQVGVGASQNFTSTGTDQDTDSISTSWKYNGVVQLGSIISAVPSGNNSTATFTPDSSFVGLGSIQAILNDTYETNTCSWPVRVIPSCSVASYSPLSGTVRLPSVDVNSTNFSVIANDSACSVEWFLNGVSVGTSPGYILSSNNSNLTSGTGLIKVVLSNGYGQSVEQQWGLTRNVPAVCSSQNPANPSQSLSYPSNITLTTNATDAENDSLTFSWKINGSTHASLVPFGATASSSSAQFTPEISQTGNNNIVGDIYDGYDHSGCSWNVAVSGDCSIATVLPASSSFKVAALGTTQTTFTVNTTTPGCAVNWKIGTTNITGTESIKIISSSSLSAGNNLITATVTNGTGLTSATWTVAKNSAPICSQNPLNSSTVNVSLGQTKNLQVTSVDPDVGDTTSVAWKDNGLTIGTGILFPIATSGTFTGAFTPTSAQLGVNVISADLSDGYDSTQCSWNTQVYNSCTIVSAFPTSGTLFPSTGTIRFPTLSTKTTGFGLIPNDVSCGVLWKLNGVTIGVTNLLDLDSDNVLINPATSNTLEATISNGIGSPVTQTWIINKNHAPTCFAKNPTSSSLNMWYNDTQNFNVKTYDSDNDTLTYSWTMNSAHSDLFSAIVSSGTTSQSEFAPTYTYLGNGQSVVVGFTDGYDAGNCAWSVNVLDPVQVNIASYSPLNTNLILKTQNLDNSSVADSQIFSVSIGAGLNVTYQWFKNNIAVSGATLTSYTVTGGTAGNWLGINPSTGTLKLVATDTYGNTDEQSWIVKANTPPVMGFKKPIPIGNIRLNYGETLTLEAGATDIDIDDSTSLSFQWYLDDSALPYNSTLLPWSSSSNWDDVSTGTVESYYHSQATLTPNFNNNLLGTHIIKAVVSDNNSVGSENREYASYSWTVEINQFSTQCNTLLNSPVFVSGTSGPLDAGKKICTIIGDAGIGGGRNPTEDQTKMKHRIHQLAMDGDNIIYTDEDSHSVFYYNRGASSVDRLGKTIEAGKVEAVLGTGVAGNSVSTVTDSLLSKDYRLNTPRGVEFDIIDATHHNLFVADYSNHRVVRVDETGTVTILLGFNSSSPLNDLAGNTDGSNNLTAPQYCQNPVGLKKVTISGVKWLFVSCNNGSAGAIKKVNIDSTTGSNYKKIYMGVGYTTAGYSYGVEDGTASLTGTARTYGPTYVKGDGLGNIYWTEYFTLLGVNHTRMRILNNTSGTLNFFSNGTVANQTQIVLTPLTNGATLWPSAASLSLGTKAASTTISYTSVYGPQSTRQSICTPIRAQLYQDNLLTLPAASAVTSSTVTIGVSAVTATTSALYSDSGCSSSLTGSNLVVPINKSDAEFYVKITAGTGPLNITAANASPLITSMGTLNLKISTSVAAFNKYGVRSPAYNILTDCSRVFIQQQDSANLQIVPSASTTIRVSSLGGGTFYSDSNCSTKINTVTLTNNASNMTDGYIYFKKNYQIKPNEVGTLLYTYNSPNITPTSNWYAGAATIHSPSGFEILTDVSGNPLGTFIGLNGNNAISQSIAYFLNFDTTTRVYGGISTGNSVGDGLNYKAMNIAGIYNSAQGFNGDGRLGPAARFSVINGITLNQDKSQLLMADYSNSRIRAFDLSIANGVVETILGAGKTRSGWNGDALIAASDAFLSNPNYLLYDNLNNLLLISDYSNQRIRSVDLAKGTLQTLIGRGNGDTIYPNEDPYALYMRGPTQISLYRKNSKDVVVFGDRLPNGTTSNQSCMVKGFNQSVNPITFFGESILGLKVSNIAGDYPMGCGTNYLYADGIAGTNIPLRLPEGMIITDDGNMFISSYDDSCIIKIDSSGVYSKYIGNCNSGAIGAIVNGYNSGTVPAYTRYPRGMFVDPLYPNNFFVVDSYDQNPGRIRYVNRGTTAVKFYWDNANAGGVNGISAPGKDTAIEPTADSYVSTIMDYSLSGLNSRYHSVAAFDNWICWSGGALNSPTDGPHNVQCIDRTDITKQVVRVAGSADNTTYKSAGATLGLEQEGILGPSSRLYAPYGLAFDGEGNLYISEYSSHEIRMVRRWW